MVINPQSCSKLAKRQKSIGGIGVVITKNPIDNLQLAMKEHVRLRRPTILTVLHQCYQEK